MNVSSPSPDLARERARLYRERPRSLLVRASALAFVLLVAYAWLAGDIDAGELFSAQRLANLRRFMSEELCPFPLRGRAFDFGLLRAWAARLFAEPGAQHGLRGMLATLSISVLAISLAGLGALVLMPFAARNLARADVFATFGGARGPRSERRTALCWWMLTATTRAVLIVLRAIPEYVWAFLLLAMLGPSAWPAVLALAIHNAGILGKLGAETVENLDPRPLRALSMLGGSRRQVALAAIAPAALGRGLLYFFYRFETCVREATVLGMLGVVSLGYWIQDARSKQYYDEMLFFVALGAAIVLAGDIVSAIARSIVRRAK